MEFLTLLAGTVLLRPYVFLFLACYLTIAIWHLGLRRTLIFTVVAYGIAFLSEYSSTRNGFPYGFYSYIDATRGQELWVSNVPFMDSLSYTFLAYVSYTMSLLIHCPLQQRGWDVRRQETAAVRHSGRTIFTGGVFFMLLDVVIDPVAFHGDRWFLGKIYTYREAGDYFNIPLTNFGGWLLVGTVILFAFTRIDRRLGDAAGCGDMGRRETPGQALFGPALYFGVLAFNLGVTFYIGEYMLGLCSLGWTAALLFLAGYKLRHPWAFTGKTS
ncbi:MAG: carotenoid biosynthesis protein [Nitrospinaceae bacterium]